MFVNNEGNHSPRISMPSRDVCKVRLPKEGYSKGIIYRLGTVPCLFFVQFVSIAGTSRYFSLPHCLLMSLALGF